MGTTIPGQSGTWSNIDEEALHIPVKNLGEPYLFLRVRNPKPNPYLYAVYFLGERYLQLENIDRSIPFYFTTRFTYLWIEFRPGSQRKAEMARSYRFFVERENPETI